MKKFICLLLATIISLSCFTIPTSAASNNYSKISCIAEAVSEVTFNDLDQNPNQKYNGIAKDGNTYTIAIEEVPNHLKASTKTWKVSYTSVVVNCYFYMDVSNNKCTRGYDKKIVTIGSTYDNVEFNRGSSYCKLSFDISSYLDIVNFNGWLKGTCTGSENDITINWSF